MEQIQRFPINYFANIFSPVKMYRHRRDLGWLKIALVFIFLNACLIAPLSLSFARTESFELGRIMPNLYEAVKDGYSGPAMNMTIKNGVLQAQSYELIDGDTLISINGSGDFPVSGDQYHKKVDHYKNALIFQKNRLILTDKNGFGFSVRYPEYDVGKKVGSGDVLADFAGKLWFQQFKVNLIPLLSGSMLAMLFLINFVLMGVVSLILWLTKFSSYSGIQTFKQAATITMFAAGCPSILAMIAGFAGANITALLMIQSLGIVMIIAFIFFRTKFLSEESMN